MLAQQAAHGLLTYIHSMGTLQPTAYSKVGSRQKRSSIPKVIHVNT